MAYTAESWHQGTFVGHARRLAPWLAVVAIAYPLLIWPLIAAPPPLANADLSPPQMRELGILNRLFFPPLVLIGLLIFIPQAKVFSLRILQAPIVIMGLYVLWAALTSYWAMEPGIAFRRSLLQMTIMASLLLPVLAARDPKGILDRLFWLFALTAAVNLAGVLTNPPGPIGHDGIYIHKNMLGGVAAMTFLFSLFRLFSARGLGRIIPAGVACVAMFLLVESQSKTSLGLSLLVPLTAFAVCALSRLTRITPALIVPAGIAGVFLIYSVGVGAYLWNFESVTTLLFGDPTLTQRTDIWQFAIKMIERRPWTGFGYEVFWGVNFESPNVREAPDFIKKLHSAHNGYIDLLIHTGWIGFIIFLALTLTLLHAIGRALRHSMLLGFCLLSLLLFCLTYNLLESTFFRGIDLQNLIFILTAALAASVPRNPWGGRHG